MRTLALADRADVSMADLHEQIVAVDDRLVPDEFQAEA